MRSHLPTLGYDARPLPQNGLRTMTDKDVSLILEFLMSKLPDDQLAELDALRAGGAANQPAMDAALGDQRHRDFMSVGPATRIEIRKARMNRAMGMATDSATGPTFPNADRLKVA